MTTLNPKPSALSREAFIAAYGVVYEASPWVAESLWPDAREGALDDMQAMRAAMRAVVDQAGPEKQLALMRAHPELAGRIGVAGAMTEASKEEQKGVGLDRCSPEEFSEFMTLNRRYNERFGFPFIIAVRGHDCKSILFAFRRRVDNDPESEFETALEQIHQIAEIRLSAMAKG